MRHRRFQVEVRGGRWEVGGGRWEVGGGRWEVGGGRWEVGGGGGRINLLDRERPARVQDRLRIPNPGSHRPKESSR